MFPVRLPSLAKESSAISAVGQLSSAESERGPDVMPLLSIKMRSGLTFFNSIRLSDLEYQSQVRDRKGQLTIFKTDFFDDSCNSPAMINSSRIFPSALEITGTYELTAYAFWKLKIKSNSHTCHQLYP
jgi:hypothetical protein